MNRKKLPALSVLTLVVFFSCTLVSNAFGFGLKNLTSGNKEKAIDIDKLVDNQNHLSKKLAVALKQINEAQSHFANALGDKKKAEECMQIAKSLDGGNTADELAKIVDKTSKNAEMQKEQLMKTKAFDGEKKRELQAGLVPYAKGTANSVILGKDFADHLKSTTDAVKQAGITDAMSIKKKLGITLAVAPKLPKLSESLVTTANTAMETAKKENLKTSDANDALASLDM